MYRVQMGEIPGSVLTGKIFYCWIFSFSCSKASDANIAIIANYGYFVKSPNTRTNCSRIKVFLGPYNDHELFVRRDMISKIQYLFTFLTVQVSVTSCENHDKWSSDRKLIDQYISEIPSINRSIMTAFILETTWHFKFTKPRENLSITHD